MKKIDLHVHTHFSDGVHSVEEIFALAKKAGLQTISITDHNWPHHIANNAKIAKNFEIDFIQGIEISAIFDNISVHILGYSKNFDLERLKSGLDRQINGFNERSRKIVQNINDSGEINLDYEKIKANFKGCIQNFPVMIELGKALKAKPFEQSTKKTYKKFSVPYGEWFMSPEEVINLIHESNGIAILAHPATLLKKCGSREKFDELVLLLLKTGIDGLEANHSEQNDQEEEEIIKLAQDNNLLVTGGSDFHGLSIHPHRILGKNGLEEKDLQKFKEKLEN